MPKKGMFAMVQKGGEIRKNDKVIFINRIQMYKELKCHQ